MNEHLDKLIIKFFFTILICLLLYVYKFIHRLLYPSSREQLIRKFHPDQNPADTIHLFSKILGIGLIFSSFSINLSQGVIGASLDIIIRGTIVFTLYLLSIYIIESITLFNFDYNDEILKRKNYTYAAICLSQSISLGLVHKTILAASSNSILLILILWMSCMVLLGLAVKAYKWISPLPFNKMIIQKEIALAFSYFGFILGVSIMIISCLNQNIPNLHSYAVSVVLNILKSIIIFPIFRWGLIKVFKIDLKAKSSDDQDKIHTLGHGIYEGVLLLTTCLFTSIIVNHLKFGSFYPIILN